MMTTLFAPNGFVEDRAAAEDARITSRERRSRAEGRNHSEDSEDPEDLEDSEDS